MNRRGQAISKYEASRFNRDTGFGRKAAAGGQSPSQTLEVVPFLVPPSSYCLLRVDDVDINLAAGVDLKVVNAVGEDTGVNGVTKDSFNPVLA